jgi:CPA2 family monovalent cation:H+ antiporter-2
MHLESELPALAAVIVVALLAGLAFERLRQPALVGYLLTGIALGPSGAGLVADREAVRFLADLGILLLLFIVGMELSLRGFRLIWKVAVGAAALQVAAALGVMALAAQAFGWSPGTAVLIGFCVALSSTAVVIKLLEDLNLLRTQVGQLTIGVLIAQDLAVIPMILTVALVSGVGEASIGLGVAKIALSVALLIALVAFLSRREKITLPFSSGLARSAELRPLYGTAWCFGAATLSGLIGLSTVYGAFLAGLIVGNSRVRRIVLHSVQPLQTLLVMVFFVSVGLLIDLDFVAANIGPVLAILAFVTVGKTVLNIAIFLAFREPWPHAFVSGLLLAQIGEFSLLLAAIGRSSGLIDESGFQLVITVTAFTLIVSPLWLATARRLMRIAVAGRIGWGVRDALGHVRSGGFKAMARAVIARPLPSGLALRVFGRPHGEKPKAKPDD